MLSHYFSHVYDPFSLQVADKFSDIVTAVSSTEDQENGVLVEGFNKLLSDPEAEVRTAAAFKIGEMAKAFGPSKTTNQLLGSIKTLARDSCQYTRAALGSVVASISSVLSKQDVLDHLLPVFLTLLKDADPEVRLNIISKIDTVHTHTHTHKQTHTHTHTHTHTRTRTYTHVHTRTQ
jgi:serine/threonine-protein phosphatase 2A regulatory subunit A